MINFANAFKKNIELFLSEDELEKNFGYFSSLPKEQVLCRLKIKDDMVLAGLPFFFEVFNYLAVDRFQYQDFLQEEGKFFTKDENKEIQFKLPFNIALSGERLALNLLQRASSIATNTAKYVKAAEGVKVLDTRKTTPGLRFLEKYAVRVGGGYNHRFSQTDVWMVKDNHKTMFGGVKNAVKFFQDQNSLYQPIIVEIHDLNELADAIDVGVKHFLLDNFSPEKIADALKMKSSDMTFEVSGGISLENIKNYCFKGIDAISSGSITYDAKQVDLSLKFSKC